MNVTLEPGQRVTADDFNDIPTWPQDEDANPFHENGDTPHGWQRINLADPQYAVRPDPPAIQGLLYHGKRHVISGPPESVKTLIAYHLLLQAQRAGHPIAVLDFEMGPTAARIMLDELGATIDEIDALYYVEPDKPPTTELEQLVEYGARYVLIDAAATAYDVTGLDDNARKDAEKFARQWIRPLWQAGVATLLIDHVTKDATTRGKFTIGSERKVGQADVHLALEALKPLTRGGSGIVKATVHKDRPGFLTRPTAIVFELASDPETHHITVSGRDPHPTDDEGHFRPTRLMQKVSEWLLAHPAGASRNEVEQNIQGRGQYVRDALDVLTKEGYISETAGPRRARIVTLVRHYSEENDPLNATSSDLVPTSSGTMAEVLRPFVPPLQGDEATASDTGQGHFVPQDEDLTDDGIPF